MPAVFRSSSPGWPGTRASRSGTSCAVALGLALVVVRPREDQEEVVLVARRVELHAVAVSGSSGFSASSGGPRGSCRRRRRPRGSRAAHAGGWTRAPCSGCPAGRLPPAGGALLRDRRAGGTRLCTLRSPAAAGILASPRRWLFDQYPHASGGSSRGARRLPTTLVGVGFESFSWLGRLEGSSTASRAASRRWTRPPAMGPRAAAWSPRPAVRRRRGQPWPRSDK